jgi:hypothetical protein
MDFYKSYALCINSVKIKVSSKKTIERYNCDIFKSLEEANNEIIKKEPFDCKLIEIYENKILNNRKLKIELTYHLNE